MTKRALIHTDGGSRGNPGPAGIGFTIDIDGERACAAGAFIGETTNNVAEYTAVTWALRNALALGVDEVELRADSELMVKQVNGEYRVKNEGLRPLFLEVKELLSGFDSFRVRHVRREANTDADELANQAMDACGTVGDHREPFDSAESTLFGEV